MADLLEFIWSTPPVTRTFAAIIFAESVLALVGIWSPYYLVFPGWYHIWKGQIWRLLSSFCFTQRMGILYDTYFVWKYAGPVERGNTRFDSSTFLVYMLFVGSLILGFGNYFLDMVVFLDPMIIAIVYTFAQQNRGTSAHFWIVNVEARFLPWLLLLMDLVQGGPMAMLQSAIGIPAAHFYDFLTLYWPQYGGGPNLLKTPSFVRQWFGETEGPPRMAEAAPGVAFQRPRPPSATSSGSSWANRGAGRRLGGD